jgi:uncharacterized membrane protein
LAIDARIRFFLACRPPTINGSYHRHYLTKQGATHLITFIHLIFVHLFAAIERDIRFKESTWLKTANDRGTVSILTLL